MRLNANISVDINGDASSSSSVKQRRLKRADGHICPHNIKNKHIHTQVHVHVHVHTHPSDALTLSHTRADVLGGIAQIVHQLLVVLERVPVDFFEEGLLHHASSRLGE